MMSNSLTAEQVLARLKNRYGPPEWVLNTEVRNSTGFGVRRTADAVAMNMYPSRGLEIYGFEIKTSRSDFLSEMKDPSKAGAIMKHVDRWWLVIGDRGICSKDELPSTWGLLIPWGDSLRQEKPAPPLHEEKTTYKPMDRPFVVALLRRDFVKDRYSEIVREEVKRQRKAYDKEHRRQIKELKEKHDKEMENVISFEKSSGLDIRQPDWFRRFKPENMGEAVKAVLDGEKHLDFLYRQYERIAKELLKTARQTNKRRRQLKEAKK